MCYEDEDKMTNPIPGNMNTNIIDFPLKPMTMFERLKYDHTIRYQVKAVIGTILVISTVAITTALWTR